MRGRSIDRWRGAKWIGLAIAAALLTQNATAQQAANVEAVAVSDGDTLHVVLGEARVRVRLSRIDAPEHGQAFGRRSEQSLRELVGRKTVLMTWRTSDRHGRPIATIEVDGMDVSREQVRRGMAWVYRRYSRDEDLLRIEQEARDARRGLWSDPHAIAPWEWRRSKKAATNDAAPGRGISPNQ